MRREQIGCDSEPHCTVQWFLFIAPAEGWHVRWAAGLTTVTILCSSLGAFLLACVLLSRKQHELLLLSLVPLQVVERVRRDNSFTRPINQTTRDAFMSSGTPAEKILDMMSQLLRGVSPSLQDVILVRTSLLQSFDLYAPIGMEQKIRDAVGDVSSE